MHIVLDIHVHHIHNRPHEQARKAHEDPEDERRRPRQRGQVRSIDDLQDPQGAGDSFSEAGASDQQDDGRPGRELDAKEGGAMKSFKPYREVAIDAGAEEMSAIQVVASNGDTVLIDVFCDGAAVERFVECWNALRHVAFPTAHVKALEDRVERLEALRKEAWSRVQELEQVSA